VSADAVEALNAQRGKPRAGGVCNPSSKRELERAEVCSPSFSTAHSKEFCELPASLKTFSHCGIGIKVHAIERRPDGRVEFTLWFTVFWIPLIPLSSWSARYRGEFDDAIREDGHYFEDLVRIQRDALCYVQTLTRSVLMLALAIAPAAILIHRTMGRAATPVEMILVFASAVWPVLLILSIERQRRRLLRGPSTTR